MVDKMMKCYHIRKSMSISNFLLLVIFLSAWRACSSWVFLKVPVKSTFSQRRQHTLKLMSTKTPSEEISSSISTGDHYRASPLSYTLDELASILGGKGRAQSCWDCFRQGIDPIWYFGTTPTEVETEQVGVLDNHGPVGWTSKQIQDSQILGQRRKDEGLGMRAVTLLKQKFGSIEENIATLTKITTSPDGTTKLLIQLKQDGLEIETVIIPWSDRKKSTLCVSSQVGCRQACTFCSTGRMGKLRSLTTDEILAQMYWAKKICRLQSIYSIDNVVFMGMGEPADNCAAVVPAAQRMMDPNLFQLAPRRVTISTVAPSPEAFQELSNANAVLAWSVHATRDNLRRQLVPTTTHSMVELRDALIHVLQGRSKRLRNVMLEITLLDDINDSKEDALHLVDFCQPLLNDVTNIKLVVNLIPWNNIGASFGAASSYRTPSLEKVLAFQKVVVDSGILCYTRTTRGDEENSACGMLATSKKGSK